MDHATKRLRQYSNVKQCKLKREKGAKTERTPRSACLYQVLFFAFVISIKIISFFIHTQHSLLVLNAIAFYKRNNHKQVPIESIALGYCVCNYLWGWEALYKGYRKTKLTHLTSLVSFCTLWKHQKTSGFLCFQVVQKKDKIFLELVKVVDNLKQNQFIKNVLKVSTKRTFELSLLEDFALGYKILFLSKSPRGFEFSLMLKEIFCTWVIKYYLAPYTMRTLPVRQQCVKKCYNRTVYKFTIENITSGTSSAWCSSATWLQETFSPGINLLYAKVLFPYPLKTSENQPFPVFREYGKGKLT